MPTIDTNAIEGFDSMTADQKVEALLGMDVPERVDLSGYVKKSLFDRTSSELAEAKKQIKSRMTEDEAAKAQEAAERRALQEKYDALLKETTIAKHTAKYLALGYDEGLAQKTAEALFDGDLDKVFENQAAFTASREAAIRAESVKNMPETKHLEPAPGKEPYVPPAII